MKLGDKVQFKIDYIKTGEYIDPEKSTEEQQENGVTLNKFKPRMHDDFKTGFICGKRNLVTKTELHYDVDRYNEYSENRFCWMGHEYGTFYLVATNLSGFHKVKLEDMERVEVDV